MDSSFFETEEALKLKLLSSHLSGGFTPFPEAGKAAKENKWGP